MNGEISWAPEKTAWWLLMVGGFVIWAPGSARLDTVAVLAGTGLLVVGLGHVVGFHRGLVHRSYRTSPWLEGVLTWLGSLAGMAGPLSLLHQHDLRDHWQNQLEAPPYFRYDHGAVVDFAWFLHGRWAPGAGASEALRWVPTPRDDVLGCAAYRLLERTWRLQQLPLAALLFALGGWDWVVWGVFGRVALTINLFWLVNYLAHTRGRVDHEIAGSREPGRNNILFGLVSFGEAWHNNHHAWPGSAQVGVRWYEADPAWWIIQALRALGLVWDVIDVHTAPKRPSPGEIP